MEHLALSGLKSSVHGNSFPDNKRNSGTWNSLVRVLKSTESFDAHTRVHEGPERSLFMVLKGQTLLETP